MSSDKQKILNWFYRQDFPPDSLEFDVYLIDAAEQGLSLSRIDAEAWVLSNVRRHWTFLYQRIEEDKQRGIIPIFRVLHEPSRRIIWSAHDYPLGPTGKQKFQLNLLRSRPFIMTKIDSFNSRQYEALGCVISRLIGSEQVFLTQTGNEGGIDFFALLCVKGASHVFSGGCSPLRVIGQCKKYSTPVQVDKVKEFLKTIEDVKNNHESVRPHIPSWFRATKGPVLGWMIAHSGFQDGAEDRAKNDGVILSDTNDLSEMAALSRRLATDRQPSDRAGRLEDLVRGVITEFP